MAGLDQVRSAAAQPVSAAFRSNAVDQGVQGETVFPPACKIYMKRIKRPAKCGSF